MERFRTFSNAQNGQTSEHWTIQKPILKLSTVLKTIDSAKSWILCYSNVQPVSVHQDLYGAERYSIIWTFTIKHSSKFSTIKKSIRILILFLFFGINKRTSIILLPFSFCSYSFLFLYNKQFLLWKVCYWVFQDLWDRIRSSLFCLNNHHLKNVWQLAINEGVDDSNCKQVWKETYLWSNKLDVKLQYSYIGQFVRGQFDRFAEFCQNSTFFEVENFPKIYTFYREFVAKRVYFDQFCDKVFKRNTNIFGF